MARSYNVQEYYMSVSRIHYTLCEVKKDRQVGRVYYLSQIVKCTMVPESVVKLVGIYC
jgi:hypothetical protein